MDIATAPRVAACTLCAALVLCLATWSSRVPAASRPAAFGAAMLWEGDPLHHELQAHEPRRDEEAWGRPLKDFHYEPRTLISLAAVNKTNSTLPRRLSADEERSALRRYFDQQQAEEEEKLRPAEEQTRQIVASQHVEMSSDEARQAAEDLPKYVAWVEGQYDENLRSQREAARKYREENDKILAYNANVHAESDAKRADPVRVGHDGAVHGIPKHKDRSPGGLSATQESVSSARRQAHAEKGGIKAETAQEYFDRIGRENAEAVRIKRAARERLARKMFREKEAEWSRVEREVRASPGAADSRIDSLRLIPPAQDGAQMRASRETQLVARSSRSSHLREQLPELTDYATLRDETRFSKFVSPN